MDVPSKQKTLDQRAVLQWLLQGQARPLCTRPTPSPASYTVATVAAPSTPQSREWMTPDTRPGWDIRRGACIQEVALIGQGLDEADIRTHLGSGLLLGAAPLGGALQRCAAIIVMTVQGPRGHRSEIADEL